MRQSRPFLFIIVLFNHTFTEKTVGFSGIQTRIVGVQGGHADHLTVTTAYAANRSSVGLVVHGCGTYIHGGRNYLEGYEQKNRPNSQANL